MRKFIGFSARQLLTPGEAGYEALDNPKLHLGEPGQPPQPNCYPLLAAINGYAAAGEDIEVIIFTENYGAAAANCERFDEAVKEICRKKGIGLHGGAVTRVEVPMDDGIASQMILFQAMIEHIDDGDILHASITYSSKVNVIVGLMALRYARMAKKNTYIECIVYGTKVFETAEYHGKVLHEGDKYIYDITPLIQFDDIFRLAAASGTKDPATMIRRVLNQIIPN